MKLSTKQTLFTLLIVFFSVLIFSVTFSLINYKDVSKNVELSYCTACIALNVAFLLFGLSFLPRLEYKLKLTFIMLLVPIFIGSICSLPYNALMGYVYQIIVAICAILHIWYTNHKLIKRVEKIISSFTNIYDARIQVVFDDIKRKKNIKIYFNQFVKDFNKLTFLFPDGKVKNFYVRQSLEDINNAMIHRIKLIKNFNYMGKCKVFDIHAKLGNIDAFSIETDGERVVIKDLYDVNIIESYIIHGADKCVSEAYDICSILGTHTISDIIYTRDSVDVRKVVVKKEDELISTIDFNNTELSEPYNPCEVNKKIYKIKEVLKRLTAKHAFPIPAVFGFNKVEEEYLLSIIDIPLDVNCFKNKFIQLESMNFVSPYMQAVLVEKIYSKIKKVNHTLMS